MDCVIETRGPEIWVESDYNTTFVARAKHLDGRWRKPHWVFNINNEPAIHNLCAEVYGLEAIKKQIAEENAMTELFPPNKEEDENWISIDDAASLMGMSNTTMYERSKQGLVSTKKGYRNGKQRLLVDIESLDEEKMKAGLDKIKSLRRLKKKVESKKVEDKPKVVEESKKFDKFNADDINMSVATATLLAAISETRWKTTSGTLAKAIDDWKSAGMPDLPAEICTHCGQTIPEPF